MHLSMIVVNYKTAAKTERLVEAVAPAVDEIIVIDNASGANDGATLTRLAGRFENVRVLFMDENLGYGAAANAGARVTSGEVMIVANPDVEIDVGDLRRLADAVSGSRVALAAPRFVYPDGRLQRSAHRREPVMLTTLYEQCRPFAFFAIRLGRGWHPTLLSPSAHEQDRECAHVLGAFMAIRRDAFVDVGGFDEGFFLYREETDLCRRLRAAGWRICHVAGAAAVHESAGSSGGATIVPLYLTSHYRYIAKHYGRLLSTLTRVLGTLGCLIWIAFGPKRKLAREPLRWHLRSFRSRGRR